MTSEGLPGASITILRAGGDIVAEAFLAAVQAATGGDGASLDGVIPGLPPMFAAGKAAAFSVQVGAVRIRCLEVLAPAPGLAEMVRFSRDKSGMEAFARHDRHILCMAAGGDGMAQTTALLQVAWAMREAGAVGIIHTSAWQCLTIALVGRFVTPEALAKLRGGMAKAMWCNLIPFRTTAGTWWATKGNHVFGVPDFALWDPGTVGAETAIGVTLALFDQVRGGTAIRPGETISRPPYRLVAGPVTEHEDALMGPGETIALRVVGAEGGADGGGAAAGDGRAVGGGKAPGTAPKRRAAPAPTPETAEDAPPRGGRGLVLVGVGAALVVAAAGAWWALGSHGAAPTTGAAAQAPGEDQAVAPLQAAQAEADRKAAAAKAAAQAEADFAQTAQQVTQRLDKLNEIRGKVHEAGNPVNHTNGNAEYEVQFGTCWAAYDKWLQEDPATAALSSVAAKVDAALGKHDAAAANAAIDAAEKAAPGWEAANREARTRLFERPLAEWCFDQTVAAGNPNQWSMALCKEVIDVRTALKPRIAATLATLAHLDQGPPIPANVAGLIAGLKDAGVDDPRMAGWAQKAKPIEAARQMTNRWLTRPYPFGEYERIGVDVLAYWCGASDPLVVAARARIAEVDAIGARLTMDPGGVAPVPAPTPGIGYWNANPRPVVPVVPTQADLDRWRELSAGFEANPGWRQTWDLIARSNFMNTSVDPAKGEFSRGGHPEHDPAWILAAVAVECAAYGAPSKSITDLWVKAAAKLCPAFQVDGDGCGACVVMRIGAGAQRFRLIQPQTFAMGCDDDEAAAAAKVADADALAPALPAPRHQVTISRGFWIADTPLTKSFAAALRGQPAPADGDLPETGLSQADCRDLLALVAKATGAAARLPTEAEWECACRAGTASALWTGPITFGADGTSPELDRVGWYAGNAGGTVHAVGKKPANPWGLFDMDGLVREWCSDHAAAYGAGPDLDPTGPADGDGHVVCRGNDWMGSAGAGRPAQRGSLPEGTRSPRLGMRIVLAMGDGTVVP